MRGHEQNRRQFLKQAMVAGFSSGMLSPISNLLAQSDQNSPKKQPNIVLIMTDDQGYGDICAHGSPYVKTPTLNRLFSESLRLKNFHVDPCCSPTRASLLTGQYSIRTGVWHTTGGRSLLSNDYLTIADVLKTNGYRTGIFGKWHLGDNDPFRPQYRGFEESVIHGGAIVGSVIDYVGNDYFDDTYLHNGKPQKYEGYCNTVWFNEAIRFIRENQKQPFFCYVSTNVPHAPLRVDEQYVKPFTDKVSERLANYYGMIEKFDEDLARLLAELKALDLEEDTLLIFMTDNGPCPWFGGIVIDEKGYPVEGYSAGMRGGKIWGYENAHRVPCYLRWPGAGIGGGKDVNRLCAHIDLLPTIIDLCGLKKPKSMRLDGTSLKSLLLDNHSPWEDRTIIVHNQRIDIPIKYKEYQVLSERWRLIRPNLSRKNQLSESQLKDIQTHSGNGTELIRLLNLELYDISKDPEQRTNIAERYPEVVVKLQQAYEAWWEDVVEHVDEYNPIIIGSDRENPTTLYAHDAHPYGKSTWVLNVAREGAYEIGLRRWLKPADKPISEIENAKPAGNLTEGHLVIGNRDVSQPIEHEFNSLIFTVHLKAGQTCMQAWFTRNTSSRPVTARYIDVKRIGPADPVKLAGYTGTHPRSFL